MNEMVDLNIKGILPSQSIGKIETCCTIIIAIIDYWQERDLLLNHYCHHRVLAGQRDLLHDHYCHYRLLAGQRPFAQSLLPSQIIGRIETCCLIIIAIIEYWQDRDLLHDHNCHYRLLEGQRPIAQSLLPSQSFGRIETCCSISIAIIGYWQETCCSIIIFAIIESQQESDLLFDHVSKTIKKL